MVPKVSASVATGMKNSNDFIGLSAARKPQSFDRLRTRHTWLLASPCVFLPEFFYSINTGDMPQAAKDDSCLPVVFESILDA